MSKAETASYWMDYLKSEGYAPELDSDGDVKFKREGLTYWIVIDSSDAEYFRLLLPNIWRAPDDAQRRKGLEAANRVSLEVKVAKVYFYKDGSVFAAVEQACTKEEARERFPRHIALVWGAAKRFAEHLQTA